MPGHRTRLLLIAVTAVCVCDYTLVGRSRSRPTVSTRGGATTSDSTEEQNTTTAVGFGRLLPLQREQETTIRPRSSTAPASTAQARSVQALNQGEVLALAEQAIQKTSRRYLSVEEYTPWQIMHGILALRGDYQLKQRGQLVSAIEYISSGPVFRGDHWWQSTSAGGRAHPYSVPYHFEGHINQFPALLSMSALPLDHQLKVKDGTITVGDIVRNAQRTVNTNEELTWTLWLLTQYVNQDATWVNQQGHRWSMAELVRQQVTAGVNDAPCGGTHQLFALAFSRNAYLKQNGQLRGVWVNAEYKLRQYIELARQLQNADGSFSTNWFKGRGYTADFKERIKCSGHMLEWLMMALPASRLEEAWVRRAIQSVASDLIRNATAPAECGPMYHALHALVLYRERVGPPKSTAPQEQLAATPKPDPKPAVEAPVVQKPAVPAPVVMKPRAEAEGPSQDSQAAVIPPAPADRELMTERPPAVIVDSLPQIQANKAAQPGVVILSPTAPGSTSSSTPKAPQVAASSPAGEEPPPAMLNPSDARPLAVPSPGSESQPTVAAAEPKAAHPPLMLKQPIPAAETPSGANTDAVAAASPEAASAGIEPEMPTATPTDSASTDNKPAAAEGTENAVAETTETSPKMAATLPSSTLVEAPVDPDMPLEAELAEGLSDKPIMSDRDAEETSALPKPAAPATIVSKIEVDDAPILPKLASDAGIVEVANKGPVDGLTIESEAADNSENPSGKPEMSPSPAAPTRVSSQANEDTTVIQ